MADTQLILIIDDEPDFREIFSTRLGAMGYRTEVAENAELGIQKAKQLKPNLILMDMRMPGMTGADALIKLKDDPETKDIKVLFLSNIGDPQPQAQEVGKMYAQQVGAAGYLRKTDDLDKLMEQIRAFIQ